MLLTKRLSALPSAIVSSNEITENTLNDLDVLLALEYRNTVRNGRPTITALELVKTEGKNLPTPIKSKRIPPLTIAQKTTARDTRNTQTKSHMNSETASLLLSFTEDREKTLRESLYEMQESKLSNLIVDYRSDVGNFFAGRWADLIVAETRVRLKINLQADREWNQILDEISLSEATIEDGLPAELVDTPEVQSALRLTLNFVRKRVQELEDHLSSVDVKENIELRRDLRMAQATIIELRSEIRTLNNNLTSLPTQPSMSVLPSQGAGTFPGPGSGRISPISSCHYSREELDCDTQDNEEQSSSSSAHSSCSENLQETSEAPSSPRCIPQLKTVGATPQPSPLSTLRTVNDTILSEQVLQESSHRGDRRWFAKAASYDQLMSNAVPKLKMVQITEDLEDKTISEQVLLEGRARVNKQFAKSRSMELSSLLQNIEGGLRIEEPVKPPTLYSVKDLPQFDEADRDEITELDASERRTSHSRETSPRSPVRSSPRGFPHRTRAAISGNDSPRHLLPESPR